MSSAEAFRKKERNLQTLFGLFTMVQSCTMDFPEWTVSKEQTQESTRDESSFSILPHQASSKTSLSMPCTVQKCLLLLGALSLLTGMLTAVCFFVKQQLLPGPLQEVIPFQNPKVALSRCRNMTQEGEKDQEPGAVAVPSAEQVFFRIKKTNFLLEVQMEGQSNWFLVCHENWDISLGMRVCRQLGHIRVTHHKGVNLTDVKVNSSQEFVQILPNWKQSITSMWQIRNRCLSGRVVALKCSECGHFSKVSRKTEEYDSPVGRWPWQAGLFLDTKHICVGSILSQEWIVTAAHCVNSSGPLQLSVWVTEAHPNAKDQRGVPVEKVIPHPSYNNQNCTNDIAMLRLKEPLRFSDTVQAACLPLYCQDIPDSATCWVLAQASARLRNVTVDAAEASAEMPIMLAGTKNCSHLCDEDGELSLQAPCTPYFGGSTDSCKVQSGGPLVCQLEHTWHLAGVGSWGPQCGDAGHYTKMAKFLNWIHRVMESS
uniref:Uncharacterized protein n=1 Tax=Salvator merianae TaxID=96440 RepID=A0A8D0E7Q6_SALMN